jgi:uncharacterized protein (DUF58 family)
VTLTERLAKPPRGQAPPKPSVAFLAHSGARDEAVLDAPSRPMRRGRMRLLGVTASSTFPFGLMRKNMDFNLPGSVLVLPARLELRSDLVPRPARRGHAGAASPTGVGHADEFFGVREYVPGDPTRLIAWRPSARRDELVVRQHGSPPPTVVWVVLDLQDGDDALERERAIALGASLVELLAARGCAVGLHVGQAGIARQPVAGAWHARRLVTALALIGDGSADTAEPGEAPPPPPPRSAPRIRRDHAALIVHARGASDGSSEPAGPAWAQHLWSTDLASYLADGATVPDPLLPPPPRETAAQRRARWVREFFLVDPVGEAAMGDSSAPTPSGDPMPAADRPGRPPARRVPSMEGVA